MDTPPDTDFEYGADDLSSIGAETPARPLVRLIGTVLGTSPVVVGPVVAAALNADWILSEAGLLARLLIALGAAAWLAFMVALSRDLRESVAAIRNHDRRR